MKIQASSFTLGVPASEVLRICASTMFPGGFEGAGPETPLRELIPSSSFSLPLLSLSAHIPL